MQSTRINTPHSTQDICLTKSKQLKKTASDNNTPHYTAWTNTNDIMLGFNITNEPPSTMSPTNYAMLANYLDTRFMML